jgi:hypothetical protein
MLTGSRPWDGYNKGQAVAEMATVRLLSFNGQGQGHGRAPPPPALGALVTKCMSLKPGDRPTASEVVWEPRQMIATGHGLA